MNQNEANEPLQKKTKRKVSKWECKRIETVFVPIPQEEYESNMMEIAKILLEFSQEKHFSKQKPMTTPAVIRDYEVVYPEPLLLKKGDQVTILRKETDPEWAGWIWCRTPSGETGWISENFLDVRKGGAFLKGDYDGTELAVQSGESVLIHKEVHGWFWCENSLGKCGWVPARNIKR